MHDLHSERYCHKKQLHQPKYLFYHLLFHVQIVVKNVVGYTLAMLTFNPPGIICTWWRDRDGVCMRPSKWKSINKMTQYHFFFITALKGCLQWMPISYNVCFPSFNGKKILLACRKHKIACCNMGLWIKCAANYRSFSYREKVIRFAKYGI